jgi:hypothetical protein
MFNVTWKRSNNMHTFKEKVIPYYLHEGGQNSAIRYRILVENEGTLTPETTWFKCTDYFNDMVIRSLSGPKFTVYGMNNENLCIRGDLFIQVKDYGAPFEKNIDNLNEIIKEKHEGYPPITIYREVAELPAGTLVLQIPRFYILNTAYISYLTALIRACAYGLPVTSYEQMKSMETKLYNLSVKPLADKLLDIKNKELLDSLGYIGGVIYAPKQPTDGWAPSKVESLIFGYDPDNGWDANSANNVWLHNCGVMYWANSANTIKELV